MPCSGDIKANSGSLYDAISEALAFTLRFKMGSQQTTIKQTRIATICHLRMRVG